MKNDTTGYVFGFVFMLGVMALSAENANGNPLLFGIGVAIGSALSFFIGILVYLGITEIGKRVTSSKWIFVLAGVAVLAFIVLGALNKFPSHPLLMF